MCCPASPCRPARTPTRARQPLSSSVGSLLCRARRGRLGARCAEVRGAGWRRRGCPPAGLRRAGCRGCRPRGSRPWRPSPRRRPPRPVAPSRLAPRYLLCSPGNAKARRPHPRRPEDPGVRHAKRQGHRRHQPPPPRARPRALAARLPSRRAPGLSQAFPGGVSPRPPRRRPLCSVPLLRSPQAGRRPHRRKLQPLKMVALWAAPLTVSSARSPGSHPHYLQTELGPPPQPQPSRACTDVRAGPQRGPNSAPWLRVRELRTPPQAVWAAGAHDARRVPQLAGTARSTQLLSAPHRQRSKHLCCLISQ